MQFSSIINSEDYLYGKLQYKILGKFKNKINFGSEKSDIVHRGHTDESKPSLFLMMARNRIFDKLLPDQRWFTKELAKKVRTSVEVVFSSSRSSSSNDSFKPANITVFHSIIHKQLAVGGHQINHMAHHTGARNIHVKWGITDSGNGQEPNGHQAIIEIVDDPLNGTTMNKLQHFYLIDKHFFLFLQKCL